MIAASLQVDVDDWITTRERVRSMRMQRHLAVAAVAVAACALVAPATATLAGFTMLSVLVGVVLNSLARAVDAQIGYLWGWVYPEPEQATRFDRSVDRAVHRLIPVQSVGESLVLVRPLDPPGL